MNTGNSSDMDMMEAETSSSAAPTTITAASTSPNDAVKDLLTVARQLVDQGKPSQALQAVVTAMRTKGGEQAVFQILQRARELYRNKLQASAEADQLASLFAECAIAEAQPARTEPSPPSPPVTNTVLTPSIGLDAYGTSILEAAGRKQVVLDAFADGSSFICLQCGGLVSNHRREEHYTYWCQF